MKILFVLGFPNPFPSAAWTRIGFFAENWSKKGHAVGVLGAFTFSTLQKRGGWKFGKVRIFNLIFNMNLGNPLVFTINSLMSVIVSMFYLIADRPRIAIVSVPTGDVGLGAIMACRLLGVKCVVDYRDEWEDYAKSLVGRKSEKMFYSAVGRLAFNLYSNSGLVVAVTSKLVHVLKQRGLTNVALVPNGADVKTFKPSPKKDDGFKLFYSGGVGGYYRLDVVLKAIKRFIEKGPKNVTLIIAGDGTIHDVLIMASQLGISKNVSYMGVIREKTELADIIAEANVGLIPYDDNPLWKNALPAKFFEYCACGLPVIATVYEDSLLGKLIRDNAIGIISPPLDDVKLAESFYALYCNNSFRKAAGNKARILIEEKFDRNKIAEEYLKLIKDN